MHSSISNSETCNWWKSWLLALIIASLLLGSLEICWRQNGYRPAVVDDQRLWSIERSKVGRSQREIVLLGSSRMQTDMSMATLRNLAPEFSIINLSADGSCANASLHDLAADKSFRGTAIVEITSECLMFGDDKDLSQQFYVDYFHNAYNLNTGLNRRIATFIQKSFVVVDPYLNLIKVAGNLVVRRMWRTPNYLNTYEDRSRTADYTKLDIAHHKSVRLNKINAHYGQLSTRISNKLLLEQVRALEEDVSEIQKRGGRVSFVRFPVSNEHWLIDEQYFPRKTYWDPITRITHAGVVHFKDIGGIDSLQCPDTSHLDVKDTAIFTTQLFRELLRRKLI